MFLPAVTDPMILHLRVAAAFPCPQLSRELAGWALRLRFPETEVTSVADGQIFRELLLPDSPSRSRLPGANFFLLNLEDGLRPQVDESERLEDRVRRAMLEAVSALEAFASQSFRPTVIFLCPPSLAAQADASLAQALEASHAACVQALGALPKFTVLTTAQVKEWYSVSSIYEPSANGGPYRAEFIQALATALMRRARPFLQPACQAIIVDADDTLWAGLVGEVGAGGVEMSQERLDFHHFLAGLRAQGVRLGIASKNEARHVHSVLARPEMVLKASDFAGWKVSWQSKSTSVRELLSTWRILPENVVFISANPLECEEVSAAFPDLVTISLPTEECAIMPLLTNHWALDLPGLIPRKEPRHGTAPPQPQQFADFLQGLELQLSWRTPTLADAEQVARLTQRTHQANATSLHRSAEEAAAVITSVDHLMLILSVKDRLADYGDVGLFIAKVRGPLCFVENFLLCSRVLGRGVEHALLVKFAEAAAARQCLGIVLPFHATARNQPMANFLRAACTDGFRDGSYHFPVHQVRSLRYDPSQVFAPVPSIIAAHYRPALERPDFVVIANSQLRQGCPEVERGYARMDRDAKLTESDKIRLAMIDPAMSQRPVSLANSEQNSAAPAPERLGRSLVAPPQSSLWAVTERLERDRLTEAVTTLAQRHTLTASVQTHGLDGYANGRLAAKIVELSTAAHAELPPDCLRVVYLDLGEDRPGRLLFIAPAASSTAKELSRELAASDDLLTLAAESLHAAPVVALPPPPVSISTPPPIHHLALQARQRATAARAALSRMRLQ